ncbi:protein SCO1/2 [Pedobacter steynii]|uniref:Protein SCO1/2 n=1 Tax=Pedobacter steynii TaxID=430522 RepID=A0A1H0FK09_9SPHI|nr:SCO family protein [Pedobacter steynii]NQX42085.1 SCO family protein [Pedobacter steynii]SDN94862.1 protein SCO1/2 [Pedobacter steynii]
MKSSQIKKILILVTILAVPGFLYYLLQDKGKNRYKPLPFFGPKEVAKTFHSVRGKQIPDTIYHLVPDFKLVNQQADSVNWKSYEGKILVLNLFYTTGNTYAVNFANKAMKAFEATYAHNKTVNFVGLSIDPSRDTPKVLSDYAVVLGAKAGKWDLLTGDSTTIYSLINKGLFIDAHRELQNGEQKFVYSNMFVLLDPQRRIRGYYEATSQEALSKLDDEIKVLITEELRNNKDGR